MCVFAFLVFVGTCIFNPSEVNSISPRQIPELMPTISDVQSLQKETLIKTDMKHLDDQGQRSSIRGPLKFSRTVCFKISGIHGSSLVLLCLVFGESSYAIAFAFSLPRRADSRQMCFFNLWK